MVGSDMAAEERNFRSAYYEKVGFRNVEEKKSLEILLKEDTLEVGKLRQFCLRFFVPEGYRSLLWKVLLGVLPVHMKCHDFIMTQRRQEYGDLLHALIIMKVIDVNQTPKSHIYYAIWLLHSGNLTYDIHLNEDRGFLPIVQTLMNLFDNEVEIYWLARNLYDNILKYEGDFMKLREISINVLNREEPELFKHFEQIGVLETLPLIKWFYCCFAGVLYEVALAKIWDKLCGGSYKIMVYVVLSIFSNLKSRLEKCNDLSGVLICFKNIPKENADIIVNKSIELWQQHGSPLTVHDKPKP